MQASGKLASPGYYKDVSGPTVSSTRDTIVTDEDDSDKTLRYITISFHSTKVAALVDSGCNVNVMSKALYDKLPSDVKSPVNRNDQILIKIANNSIVRCCGSAKVSATFEGGKTTLKVLVMSDTSNPLILGTSFLTAVGAKLDFSKNTMEVTKVKLRTAHEINVPAKSEYVITVKVPSHIPLGANVICTGSRALKQGHYNGQICCWYLHSTHCPHQTSQPWQQPCHIQTQLPPRFSPVTGHRLHCDPYV